MTRNTLTRKTANHQSSKPSRSKTERMALHTLEESLADAVRTFAPNDAICSLGDAWCSLADLSTWIAAQPAAHRAECRFATGIGNITERSTGVVASH